MNVRIPKYEVPILAARKKKIVTDAVDAKIKIQEGVSNSFTRFQVGDTLAGYLENQYSRRYINPGAQTATFALEGKQL